MDGGPLGNSTAGRTILGSERMAAGRQQLHFRTWPLALIELSPQSTEHTEYTEEEQDESRNDVGRNATERESEEGAFFRVFRVFRGHSSRALRESVELALVPVGKSMDLLEKAELARIFVSPHWSCANLPS